MRVAKTGQYFWLCFWLVANSFSQARQPNQTNPKKTNQRLPLHHRHQSQNQSKLCRLRRRR